MLETLLAIATVIGAVPAAWFVWDKLRTVKWRKHQFAAASPAKVITKDPVFPDALEYVVDQAFPDYRLPRGADMQHDWAEYGDIESLSPFMCTGDFTGQGGKEYAVFLIGRNESKYKAVAFVRGADDDFLPHLLREGPGLPTNQFVRAVEPGYYRPGPSAVKLGSPRIVRLKRPGINIGMFESADALMHWDGSKFVETWMSD